MHTPAPIAALLVGAGMLTLPVVAHAHVEYYDLNQGKQVADLTAAGKVKSTEQYGATPATVMALSGSTANGLGTLSSQSDRPLNDTSYWNNTYQAYGGAGSFSNIAYNAATGSGSATVVVDDVTAAGWARGTKATLGDSHTVDFFNFRLTTAQRVTITWNVDIGDGSTFFDSAFSLYSGVLSYQGHDDANEKLNPKTGLTTKVQDALDASNAPMDAQGIASSYRNTTASGPGTYVGQFNALANWGQANAAGNWSNIAFITYVNANNPADGYSTSGASTLESLTIDLGPGNYTIAASGAVGATTPGASHDPDGVSSLTGLRGTLKYSATAIPAAPVPEPGTWAMLLCGLAVVGGIARRRALTR